MHQLPCAFAEGNLAQVLSERGSALSERETCCMLVVPVLVSLWHLSQHGILHGDIKLENIFVSNRQAFLGDFGASQRVFVRISAGLCGRALRLCEL